MYLPAPFRVDDIAEIQGLVDRQPVAHLVTVVDGVPTTTVLPVLLAGSDSAGGHVVLGHLARANPQARHDGAPALVTWLVSSAYISPSMYATKHAGDPEVVPTWNYEAVEVTGTLRVSRDPQRIREIVTLLTEHHERDRAEPWAVSDAPEDFLARMGRAIVAVEVEVDTLEAKRKLSQNRPADDIASVEAELGEGSPLERLVAEAMAAVSSRSRSDLT